MKHRYLKDSWIPEKVTLITSFLPVHLAWVYYSLLLTLKFMQRQ